jgi:hypothetical protein
MYMLEPILAGDNAFLQGVKLVGKWSEEMRRDVKERKFGKEIPQTNTTKNDKENIINKNNDNRYEKEKEETYKNNK